MSEHDEGRPGPPQQPPGYGYGYAHVPPERPRTSPWVWVALATVIGVVVVAVLAAGVWFLAYPDEYYDDGYDTTYYYVEQGSVLDAIEAPCEELRDVLEDVRPFGTDGPAGLARIGAAMQDVAAAVEGADPDEQSRQFARDWSAAAAAVTEHATALESDEDARFEMPRARGMYVSERIFSGNDSCYVPTIVQALDPELADQPAGY